MCQAGWWRWDVPGKGGGMARASAVVALGDTAQLCPSPSWISRIIGDTWIWDLSPPGGQCWQQGQRGQLGWVSPSRISGSGPKFQLFLLVLCLQLWCHLRENGGSLRIREEQRCPRIPNSWCSCQLSHGWVPGRSLELRWSLDSSPGRGCGVGSECCRNRTNLHVWG